MQVIQKHSQHPRYPSPKPLQPSGHGQTCWVVVLACHSSFPHHEGGEKNAILLIQYYSVGYWAGTKYAAVSLSGHPRMYYWAGRVIRTMHFPKNEISCSSMAALLFLLLRCDILSQNWPNTMRASQTRS